MHLKAGPARAGYARFQMQTLAAALTVSECLLVQKRERIEEKVTQALVSRQHT